MSRMPRHFWVALQLDVASIVGLFSVLMFGPELMTRAGWWPRPLAYVLAFYWFGQFAVRMFAWRRDLRELEEHLRGPWPH